MAAIDKTVWLRSSHDQKVAAYEYAIQLHPQILTTGRRMLHNVDTTNWSQRQLVESMVKSMDEWTSQEPFGD